LIEGTSYFFLVFDFTPEGYTDAGTNVITAGENGPATYACWGGNTGACFDGIYMSEFVSGVGYDTSPYAPEAGNVRPIQIDGGEQEFMSVGWFVGYAYNLLLYPQPTYYVDGCSTEFSGTCPYFNIAFTVNDNSPGNDQWDTFQIQRRGDPNNATFYHLFVGPGEGASSSMVECSPNVEITEGSEADEMVCDNSDGFGPFHMQEGQSSNWGAEDAQGPGANDMYTDFTDVYSHAIGAPSTSPPGVTNYSEGWLNVDGADNGCSESATEPPENDSNGGAGTITGVC
jgi:hypothetical protein